MLTKKALQSFSYVVKLFYPFSWVLNFVLYMFVLPHVKVSIKLQLYQVRNISSPEITEVKQLGPWLALGWVTIHVLKLML